MRKSILSLAAVAGLLATATAAMPITAEAAPRPGLLSVAPAAVVQPVQYYGGYGRGDGYYHHREYRHWHRHHAWRRWHHRHGW